MYKDTSKRPLKRQRLLLSSKVQVTQTSSNEILTGTTDHTWDSLVTNYGKLIRKKTENDTKYRLIILNEAKNNAWNQKIYQHLYVYVCR